MIKLCTYMYMYMYIHVALHTVHVYTCTLMSTIAGYTIHAPCIYTTRKVALYRSISEHNKHGVIRYSLNQSPPPNYSYGSSMCFSLSEGMVVPVD